MRRRPIVLYAFALAFFLAGYIAGLQSAPAPEVRAQTSTKPAVTRLLNRGTATQAWMEAPFCLDPAWWDGVLCSEVKGPADAPAPGFVYKLDFPIPACVAFVGKDGLGRWQLSAVPSANGQCPGDNLSLVSGPCLVQAAGYEPATPLSPTATGTPPHGATATPTVIGGITTTSTPSPRLTLTPVPVAPVCSKSIAWYVAGDPAMGGLGGRVGEVVWCAACRGGCGQWQWGVTQEQMDGAVQAAEEHLTR